MIYIYKDMDIFMEEKVETDDIEIEMSESELKGDQEFAPLKYEISTIPADYTLEMLYQKWRNDEIIIPKFQRSYIWKIGQASRLIESFMIGLPVPPVFLYINSEQKYFVIDGRQRLQTVFYFFDGFFGEPDNRGRKKLFQIEEINKESKWYKTRFGDFDEKDQLQFKNTVLRTILVKQLEPKQEATSIYHIFERLNTGGTSLQDQEIRNCIFAGSLNNLLDELNHYENWRIILGKEKPDTRQKDVQLILRYMSLFHNSEKYRRPMKDFLSKFMEENREPNDRFLQEEENRFKKTCDKIVQHLGKRPFNPKGALNPSIFDSIFTVFAKHTEQIPNDIAEKFALLCDCPEFKKATSEATSDPPVVLGRLKLVEEELFG